ncbi:nacht domain [Fusarium longipes]|uniref:Nacht domain n=1 Tax=Fusarium longipes TaxID=694270 RepID=A0A395SKA9_9HYPO|nr:nacht domain [Fusarium longipes]
MSTTQAAFEAAMLEFKDKLKDSSLYDQILQTSSIEQAYNDIKTLQDKQVKSGRLRHFSKIDPFLNRLREYSSSIEVFVQAKPDILALVWGPVKLLLQWADVLKQSFDAPVNAMEEIGNVLPDFCELSEMFSDNNRLQELQVLYFQDILQFYLISTKFFSMRRESPKPSIIHFRLTKVLVTNTASHRDLIRKEVRMEEIRRANDLRNRELEHIVQTEENNTCQEYASHRAHISPRFYDSDLYRFTEAVCTGTGKWLFGDPSFQSWLDGKEKGKPILWLRGIPGAGKTLLASSVIKHTQQLHGTYTVFAFLTYLDGGISSLSIIHSLIFQLTATPLPLKTMLCQSDLQNVGNDFGVASALFQTLVQSAGVVHVIIDGLDEIQITQRSRLIKELIRLSHECEDCRILLTSRTESDISRDLDGYTTNLQVDQNNAGSIKLFINRRMEEWFKERKFLPNTSDQIRGWSASLAYRAKGMFLYVKVIFRILYHINDIEDIRDQLEHLPMSLEDAYGRVLQQINDSTDPQRKKLARLILGWVGCAPSPMTLKEIEQAVLVDPNHPRKQPRVQATIDVIQLCSAIVDVVDGSVRFVHFTVREYIFSPQVKNHIPLSEMALDLAMRCVVYLCQEHHDPDVTKEEIDANIRWGAYRLHYFSSTFWLELINRYLRLSSSATLPNTLTDQLRELLETRSSEDHMQTDQDQDQLHPVINGLLSEDPALVEMLKSHTAFQKSSFKSEFHLDRPDQWLHMSPLSIPKISIIVHERLDTLVDQGHSFSEAISYHYGPRPFTCGFLGCHYRCYGFEKKSGRQAHERHHEKPWNCNYPGCRYATQGFISRKMRDDHFENGHLNLADSHMPNAGPPEKFEDEEIQPLMFDLIDTNQVEIIKSLIPRLDVLDRSVQRQFSMHAARIGSSTVLQLFYDCGLLTRVWTPISGRSDWDELTELAVQAIDSECANLSKVLISWIMTWDTHVYKRGGFEFRLFVQQIVSANIAVESQELFNLWKPNLTSGFGVADMTSGVAPVFIWPPVIAVTENIPKRERMLIDFWEEFKLVETSNARGRSPILANIANSSCSINLTQYALDHGCLVDAGHNSSCPTALQYAARKTTEAAANLMEFLLLQGADPNKSNSKKSIGDEKGAREVSKWLGVTWEQLVERTTKEHQRNEQTRMEHSSTDQDTGQV